MDKNLYNFLEDLKTASEKVEQAKAQKKAATDFLKDCKAEVDDVMEELLEYFNRTKTTEEVEDK